MANKCRICGYKFKRNDGPICPECFTAREDELTYSGADYKSSNIFGKSNNDYPNSSDSFLSQQINEENDEDQKIKRQLDMQQNQSADAYRKEGIYVNNNTYANSAKQQTRNAYTRPNTNTNPIPPYGNNNNFANNNSPRNLNIFPTYSNQNRNTKRTNNSLVKAILIIFFLLFFALPVIVAIIDNDNDSTYYSNEETYDYNTTTTTYDYDYNVLEYTDTENTYNIALSKCTTKSTVNSLENIQLGSDTTIDDYIDYSECITTPESWSIISIKYDMKQLDNSVKLPSIANAMFQTYTRDYGYCYSYIYSFDPDNCEISFVVPAGWNNAAMSMDLLTQDFHKDYGHFYFDNNTLATNNASDSLESEVE